MFVKNYFALLFGIALTVVNAKVTFKVVAVDGTPSVVINNKKYSMTELDYPVYQAVVDVNTPVEYHYSLKTSSKTEEEKFTIKATSSETLIEFFDRSITVKKHPLLPKIYETPSTVKQSKLYDDTQVATVLITGNESDIKKLHSDPENEELKANVKVIYVNPYTIKKFNSAKFSISGQSTTEAKKLSYKLTGLKDDQDKELFGRSAIKIRAEHMDPSFLREKIYGDILNSLGVPTIQNNFIRLYINKKPIGLFDITDDIKSGHFLKNTFNGGEKYAVDNHVFKADYYPDGGCWGDLGYHGTSSRMYDIYYYKGETKNADSEDMVKDHLIPFLNDSSKYPSTGKLNFDVKSFLKQMAVEYVAGGMDNYWLRPGNFFIFKDVARNQWSFIDCDFHYSLGLSGNYDTDKLINYSIKDYPKYNDQINTTSRPLLDNIRKISSNESFFMDVFKNLVKYTFNVHALGPRIDSLAELIREDAYWDFKLPKANTLKGANDYGYTAKTFDAQVKNTSIPSGTTELFPLKYWIIKRSEMLAKQLGVSVPSSAVKSSLGNYSNVAANAKKEAVSNAVEPTTPVSNDLPISKDGKCGSSVGTRCPDNQCCSQYGYCGTTDAHCVAGCQAKYGLCKGTSKKTTTTTKKTTNSKKTTTTSKKASSTNVPVSKDGKCGSSAGTKCPSGQCCSKYGYCGTTSDYCAAGCQASFGNCNGTKSTTAKKTTTTTKKTTKKTTTTTKKATSKTTNKASSTVKVSIVAGRCGPSYGKCPGDNVCCSQYNYCGTTNDHCKKGCQPQYGLCL